MTLKQRALWDVAKVLALGVLGGTLITVAVDQFGLPLVGITVSVAMLVYLAKIAYDIRLGQLRYEADRVERAIREGR